MAETNLATTPATADGVTVAPTDSIALDNFDYTRKIAALTPAEREKYAALGKKLDVHDTNSIMTYGAEVSNIVARNGDVMLSSVQSNGNIEVFSYINKVVAELNGFQDDINRYSGVHSSILKRLWYSLPGIKKLAMSLDNVMTQYSSVSTNVDKISQKITSSKTIAARDNSTLQQLFDNNKQYIVELRDLIIGAKLQDEAISAELERMYSEGAETIEIQRVQNFQNRLRKRIEDLQTSAAVFYQNLFQIEAIKENNNALIEQSNNIVNHVIPIWKSQLPIAIMLKNQQDAAKANALIKETTRKLIVKTSADLEQQSIEIARQSEEATIDLDTLQQSTQHLINTITAVKDVHDKGTLDRQHFEESLQSMCDQLNKAVIGLTDESKRKINA